MTAHTTPPTPKRLSQLPPEQRKPSKIIEAFWWIVFIIPIGFVWVTSQNYLLIGALIALRIGMILVPKYFSKRPPPTQPQKTTALAVTSTQRFLPASKAESSETIKVWMRIFKDEAQDEWRGLLKVLRIYDHEKEDPATYAYRRIRGWE